MVEKRVTDLKHGDKMDAESGEIVTVRDVGGKGFFPGSVFVNYTNGEWSCLPKTATVRLAG